MVGYTVAKFRGGRLRDITYGKSRTGKRRFPVIVGTKTEANLMKRNIERRQRFRKGTKIKVIKV